jgi:hypothetical protein
VALARGSNCFLYWALAKLLVAAKAIWLKPARSVQAGRVILFVFNFRPKARLNGTGRAGAIKKQQVVISTNTINCRYNYSCILIVYLL